MPTNTKKSKTKPSAGRKPKNSKNRGLGSAIGELASRLGPGKKGGRARKPAKRGLAGIAAGAGRSTRARKPSKSRKSATAAGAGVRFRPRRPSRKGLVGIAAGAGLGGAAMAKSRRRGHQGEATNWPADVTSASAREPVAAAAHPDQANDSNGGAEHGDPKGPGFADAA
jgi:hypothetical protein